MHGVWMWGLLANAQFRPHLFVRIISDDSRFHWSARLTDWSNFYALLLILAGPTARFRAVLSAFIGGCAAERLVELAVIKKSEMRK
jgi:hypothetical protein